MLCRGYQSISLFKYDPTISRKFIDGLQHNEIAISFIVSLKLENMIVEETGYDFTSSYCYCIDVPAVLGQWSDPSESGSRENGTNMVSHEEESIRNSLNLTDGVALPGGMPMLIYTWYNEGDEKRWTSKARVAI